MKRSYFLMMALGLGALVAQAQDDDVYYVPSAQQKAAERAARQQMESSYSDLEERHAARTYENSDWAVGRKGAFDVDAYNRRKGTKVDTMGARKPSRYDEENDYDCTTRIVRFHAPTVGIFVSSPYYMDYYNYWYSPLHYGYYDPFWSDWTWGWGSPWRSSWYGGWGSPWYSGWYGYYSPWYDSWSWGWRTSWYGGWSYPHYWRHFPRPDYVWRDRNYQRGPVGGGRSFATNGRSGSLNDNNNRSSRRYEMPSRNYNYDVNNGASSRTRSRGYQPQQSAPSRSYEAPARTYSQPSMPARTYGGSGGSHSSGGSTGGGRTFGR